jgi:hypothetical protein
VRFGPAGAGVGRKVPRLGAVATAFLLVAGLLFAGATRSEAAPTTWFQLDSAAATAFTGQPVDLRVRARDDAGNVDTAYRGTVHFTSSDAGAVLPPDYTFTEADAGDKTFTGLISFSAPGNQVVTATEVGQPGIRGDSNDIQVYASVVTHLQVDASGGNNTAGQPIGIRVRARSDRGDVVPDYRGTIRFTSTDPGATLPPDYTFTAADNGDHFFADGLRYATAGAQSISAFDVSTPGIRGDSFDTVVSTTGATQLDVDTSGGSTAGQPLTIRVRARDNNGNVDTTYRGTIHFTSTDPAATLPADYTFTAADNGDHTFSTGAKYATPGNQSVTAVEVGRPSIRGDSLATFVYAPGGTNLDVDLNAGSITAGDPVTVRVRVRNERGDVDTGYRGTVRFTSTDAGATLPADYTFTAADNGDKSFATVRFATTGNQSVSAADVAKPALRGDSATVLVYARTTTRFEVTTAASVNTGQAVSLRVRARNDRGDIDTSYRGSVSVTSTDPGATLPATYTFVAADNGDHTFTTGVTFATTGSQSVAVVDTATPTVRGRSEPTRVGSAAVLAVDVFEENPTAGLPETVRVTAITPTGTQDNAYRGTVRLTSTDPGATLPAEYTFTAADNGRHDFPNVAFATAGTQTLDAADTADPARRGSDTVYVYPAAATQLQVEIFSTDATAGHPITLRVRARNANGDIDTAYRGTVRVTSNDPAATLPADHTFTATDNGEHTFASGVTYVTPGNRAVSVADTARPTLRGDSGSTLVTAATATYLEVQVFSSVLSAGESASLRIRARNSNGHIDTGYRGTVHISSSDAAAGLPADFTFTAGDQGERTFTNGVTYNTPGSQSVSAQDTANTNLRGDSGPTLVLFTGAVRLEVQVFASDITAGRPETLRIRARNANGDIDTGYRGTVHFTSTDAGATLPPDYTFTAGDAGEHTFTGGVTFATRGHQSVSAADVARPVRGSSGSVHVYPAGATHLDVEAFVTEADPGEPFDVRVTARNDLGDIDTAYRGTIHFASTDAGAVLPPDYTFTAGDNGRRLFTDGASLATAGSHTISAADTSAGSTVRGFSSRVLVLAGPPPTTTSTSTSTTSTSTTTSSSTTTTTTAPNLVHHFDVEVFASQVTAGRPVDVRVTARDAGNAIATGYRGTVHLTSTDGGAVLAADATFTATDNGRHTFTGGVRFGTAGNQRVTATDTASPSITGQSGAVLVVLPDATHFDVEIFSSTVTTGQAVDVRVTARSDLDDIDQGYRGTIAFTSTDAGATLPPNYTFTAADAGRRTFTAGVAFATAGTQRVTAAETARPSVTGQSGPVTVQAAAAVRFVVAPSASTATSGTPVSVQVTAQRADGTTDTAYTGTVRFTSTDAAATLPADYPFVAADNGRHTFSPGVTFRTAGNQTVTVTATANSAVNGTSPAVLVDAPPPSTTTSTSTSTTTTTSTSTTTTTSTSTTTTVPSTTTTTRPCSPPTVNVQPSTMRAGDAVTVSGCGFGANKPVTLTMFSSPVVLGQTTANGTGNYSSVVVIPADATPGNHTIVASGQNGESVASEGSTGIFISGPPLDDNGGGGDPGTTIPNTTIPNTTIPNTTIPNTTIPNTTVPATTVPPATTIPGTTVPQSGGTESPSEGTGSPSEGTGTGTGTGAGGTGTGTGTAGGTGTGTGPGGTGTGTGLGTVGTGGALGPGTNVLGSAGAATTTGTLPGGTSDAIPTLPGAGGGVALGAPGGGTPTAQAGAGGGGSQAAQAGAGAAQAQSSGHSRTAPLQPRPGFEEQSELVTAVPTPADISTDPETIAANVLLAIALILLIGFPADIFNSTLLEHYDEVRGWFRFGRRRREAALARAEAWFDRLPTPIRLGTFGLMGSILYGLLDPNFGFNRPSVILVLGLLLAIATISTVLDLLRVRYHDRVTRKHARLRAFPLGLVMAGILVFFSRVGDFHPGYVFGVFTALAFEDELYDEEDGRGVAVAGVGLLVVALLALFLRGPVDQLAGPGGASFIVLVVDAALATLWIAGIQAVIWGLIPIKFMYGQKVLAWSKWGWLAIYGTGMLLFVHTLLHPGMGLYGNAAEASLLSVTMLFLGFGAFSLCFWAYFRFRKPRPPTFEPVAGGRTLVSGGAVSRFDRLPPA